MYTIPLYWYFTERAVSPPKSCIRTSIFVLVSGKTFEINFNLKLLNFLMKNKKNITRYIGIPKVLTCNHRTEAPSQGNFPCY